MKNMTVLLAVILFAGCTHENQPSARSYRMGFQNSAPRFDDANLFLQSLALWSQRADAAMITTEVPWDTLYAGKSVVTYVVNNYSGLVAYYRSKNFKLWIYIDPANGLNRAADANALVTLGKSIAQSDVQALYRRFVFVMDSVLVPDHLGLALETNLIRATSPPSIYDGVRKAANDAAADVLAYHPNVKLSISVQADVAWGKLGGTGAFAGIGEDLTDFSFISELGISSYPYFSFTNPDDIPLDYYSKLVEGHALPLFVSEGGWTSETFDGPNLSPITGSTASQLRYIERQAQMLDEAKAIAWFQLTFTDIDIDHLPTNIDPTIKYFAYLGLVDLNLESKPSLNAWDQTFHRMLSE